MDNNLRYKINKGLENAYEAIHNKRDIDSQNENYILLGILVYAIIANKEHIIIDKKESPYKDEFLAKLKEIINVNFNNKEDSNIDFLNTLRNKLAHGKFDYNNEEENIIIHNRNKDIEIPIFDLFEIYVEMTMASNVSRKDGNEIRYIFDFNKIFLSRATDFEYYHLIIRTIMILCFQFYNINDKNECTEEDYKIISKWLFKNSKSFFDPEKIGDVSDDLESLCNTYGLTFDGKCIFPKNYNMKLFDKYYDEKNFGDNFKKLSKDERIRIAINFIMNIFKTVIDIPTYIDVNIYIEVNDIRCAELEKNESEINDKINLFNKNITKYDNLDNGIKKKQEIYKVNNNDKLLEQINKEKEKAFELLIKMRGISLKINELVVEKKRIINDNRLFDERYTYNANFIRHLRNNICHANFEIDYRYKLKDIDDYYVNFKDYDDNKELVFDASLSRDDSLKVYTYLNEETISNEIKKLDKLLKLKN